MSDIAWSDPDELGVGIVACECGTEVGPISGWVISAKVQCPCGRVLEVLNPNPPAAWRRGTQ